MRVVVKTESGVLPERKTTEAAGYDLCAYLPADQYPNGLWLNRFEVAMIPTGLYFAPEPGTTVLVVSRSGLAAKGVIVVNAPGVVDSDYQGEVKVLLMRLGDTPVHIQNGDRIAQLLFVTSGSLSTNVEFEAVETLPAANSNRLGGFGSTGK